ncbi:MAG: mechanosensitive ion channel [Rhizobiaceae bacterium]|nr:mechanosensitive ion channel [Rhizobiaceae bacterium]
MKNLLNINSAIFFLLACIFLSIQFSFGALAQQLSSVSDTSEQQSVAIPDPLTPEAVRELVSRLSDQEVRDLLLERLDAVAREQVKETENEESALTVIINAFAGIGNSVQAAVVALPNVGTGVSQAFNTFKGNRGTGGLAKFLGITAFAIFLGVLANLLINQVTKGFRSRYELIQPDGMWETIRTLVIRFCLDLVNVGAFALISLLAIKHLHDTVSDAEFAARFVTNVILIVMLFAAFSRFSVAPVRSDLRLLPVDDTAAKRFHSQTIWAAVLLGIGPFVLQSLVQFGIPFGTLRLGFWINLALHVYIICAIYYSKQGVIQAVVGKDDLMGPTGIKFARYWPYISMFLIFGNWIFTEILAGAERFDLLQGQTYVTLLLITFFPLLDTGVRGLVLHLSPPMLGEGPVAERAYRATQRAYLRMGRVILLTITLVSLARLFGVDLSDTQSSNFTERLIAQVIDGTLYFFIGYLVWEAAGVWINRKLAEEQTAAGIDLDSDEPGGGEGGGTGLSRLATVLPVIRLVLLSAIVVMTILLGLSRLGVDTTPLLAGAGIVGLAIGFGAQTLVRDVVSGIFFLVDDAFRVGEYLVIDDTVGTVEKISIRSLQLRHHKGAVHTIPYGEIPKVTNNSRDWVIMKLKFTFPFDTDVNRIKKLFKKVGAEMLEADYAEDLIQTFKSQGVYDVDDVGIVVRGKFMSKPGKQWVIRKDVYSRVQKVLDEAGIEFARREVRVQIPGIEKDDKLSEGQAKTIGAAAANAVSEAGEPGKT